MYNATYSSISINSETQYTTLHSFQWLNSWNFCSLPNTNQFAPGSTQAIQRLIRTKFRTITVADKPSRYPRISNCILSRLVIINFGSSVTQNLPLPKIMFILPFDTTPSVNIYIWLINNLTINHHSLPRTINTTTTKLYYYYPFLSEDGTINIIPAIYRLLG